MTGRVQGNVPQGRFTGAQPPPKQGRGIMRFGLWPLLLAAGLITILPLLLLAVLMFVRPSSTPAPAAPPARVAPAGEPVQTTAPVKPCYPFQTDCVPG
ncbi:hypothetical protein LTV02_05010 [Nocardia yamanashiensis]|uniref:hypothetical protein n=1 Tax=Nocardia yamanashiensis TaxID=209247 RepID=UPI001E630C79|nr:hypothetical protein [Nocardia yamanashiensis]UGT42774.1 hypothetical protein LTV02_05010 [Nocardia yamanashiensis]